MLKKYHVGEFITNYMDVQNITETDLANGSGVSRSHISKIRSGNADISPEVANKISDMLNVKASFLLSIQLSYIRFTSAQSFIEINKKIYSTLNENIKFLFESSQNISMEELDILQSKPSLYTSARGFAYYSPNKPNYIKNYILMKSIEAIPKPERDLDIEGLHAYINTEYKHEVSKIKNSKDANISFFKISKTLQNFGVNLEIMETGLNTTINGLTNMNERGATIFIENKGYFSDTIWYLTHEIMHILNQKIKNEEEINELAERLLIGEFSNAITSINNEDMIFENKALMPNINPYIFANIWRFKNKIHTKKDRKEPKGGINDLLHTQLSQA